MPVSSERRSVGNIHSKAFVPFPPTSNTPGCPRSTHAGPQQRQFHVQANSFFCCPTLGRGGLQHQNEDSTWISRLRTDGFGARSMILTSGHIFPTSRRAYGSGSRRCIPGRPTRLSYLVVAVQFGTWAYLVDAAHFGT